MNKAKTVILNCENIYWGIKDKETVRKVIVEDGVTSQGIGTFTDCRNLMEIELPDSVTVLGLAAFMNCSSLLRIKLPDKVKIIEQSAFMNCSSLAEVELPDPWCPTTNAVNRGIRALLKSSISPVTLRSPVMSISHFSV